MDDHLFLFTWPVDQRTLRDTAGSVSSLLVDVNAAVPALGGWSDRRAQEPGGRPVGPAGADEGAILSSLEAGHLRWYLDGPDTPRDVWRVVRTAQTLSGAEFSLDLTCGVRGDVGTTGMSNSLTLLVAGALLFEDGALNRRRLWSLCVAVVRAFAPERGFGGPIGAHVAGIEAMDGAPVVGWLTYVGSKIAAVGLPPPWVLVPGGGALVVATGVPFDPGVRAHQRALRDARESLRRRGVHVH